jgi:hypothetical protein
MPRSTFTAAWATISITRFTVTILVEEIESLTLGKARLRTSRGSGPKSRVSNVWLSTARYSRSSSGERSRFFRRRCRMGVSIQGWAGLRGRAAKRTGTDRT